LKEFVFFGPEQYRRLLKTDRQALLPPSPILSPPVAKVEEKWKKCQKTSHSKTSSRSYIRIILLFTVNLGHFLLCNQHASLKAKIGKHCKGSATGNKRIFSNAYWRQNQFDNFFCLWIIFCAIFLEPIRYKKNYLNLFSVRMRYNLESRYCVTMSFAKSYFSLFKKS